MSSISERYCCPVCNSHTGTLHHAREMMLGSRDNFPYWECSQCGCLSLMAAPSNYSKYYPSRYYSFHSKPASRIRKLRDSIYLSSASFLVNWRKRTDLDVIRRLRLSRDSKVSLLDVGCGTGQLLGDLRELGYNAEGIDPFVPHDIHDRFGLRVRRKTLSEVQREYDFLLFRHSLEHMPLDSLRLACKCVKSTGICVVCIPVVGWAWKHYRTNWVQLDAPRHVTLHTCKSFVILAAQSGFQLERVVFDSNELQFWASECYEKGIPLTQATPPRGIRLMRMRMRARSLNRRGLGDSAQFYLRPRSTMTRTW